MTDLEYRVWTQYLLSADDFGVMRASAVTLQADNDALDARPARLVQRALDHLIAVELVRAFEHQRRQYVFQLTWQDYQKVGYPRGTVNPKPDVAELALCTKDTRKLFEDHPGGKGRTKPKPYDNGSAPVSDTVLERAPNGSETFSSTRAGAGAKRLTANGKRLTANGDEECFRGAGPMSGALPRDHASHVLCDDTFSRCVPSAVHGKLASALAPRHGGDREAAKSALLAWYPTVWATLAAEFVMGDAFRFWQGRFDVAFATKDVRAGPGNDRTPIPSVEATSAYLRRLKGVAS